MPLHISAVPHNYQYYSGRILFCCHEQLITCTMRFKFPTHNLKRREMSLRLELVIYADNLHVLYGYVYSLSPYPVSQVPYRSSSDSKPIKPLSHGRWFPSVFFIPPWILIRNQYKPLTQSTWMFFFCKQTVFLSAINFYLFRCWHQTHHKAKFQYASEDLTIPSQFQQHHTRFS